MKENNLTDGITEDALKEEKDIIANAKKQAEQKAKEMIDCAKNEAKKIEENAKEQALSKKKEKLYEYEQEAKKIILTNKKEMLEQVYLELRENIKTITGSKREEILQNLLLIAKKEIKDISVIYTSATDVSTLKNIEKNIRVEEDKEMDFGIIAQNKDKTIILDLSLNSLSNMFEKKIMSAIMGKIK
ncbi:MAG: hypothetical protein KAR87_06130 [Candidatus Aenigmarchaeota archaeon]|nr:hypothetical protein [Candidatus Aenigmarchaeota archaeon]